MEPGYLRALPTWSDEGFLRIPGPPGPADAVFVSSRQACVRVRGGAMWCWGDDHADELRGETPENCQIDNLHLTVSTCVSTPQPLRIDE
jgi:hypothetical protein